jgi:hypothetical protein
MGGALRGGILWCATLSMMACAPGREGPAEWPTEAGASVTVGSAVYQLEVEAWRSFQPILGEQGDPMLAVLRLASDDVIPADVALSGVRLRRRGDTWGGNVQEESPREPGGHRVEFMLRGGPRWPAGDSIQVQVQLTVRGSVAAVLGVRTVITRVD